MLMKSRVKFNSLQNTSGVSQEKDIAVIRNQTLKCTYWTHKRPPYCSSEVIQVSWGLDILSCFEKCYWRLVFSLNVYCSPYVLPFKLVTIHYNCLEDGRMLFFPVKLQQSFVDGKSSPNLPLAWGWEDNDRIFIVGVNHPVASSCKVRMTLKLKV